MKKSQSRPPVCTYGASLEKSGAVRICVDLKRLNLSVERERYILPTLQDLTSRLAGATVFSSLDAASGFYQIPLHEASQELTTFITPMGRYCYRRLPFGITSAPEIFMRKMNELLYGLDGVFTYMDDILIYGKDKAEHDERLNKVLKVLASAGLILNRPSSDNRISWATCSMRTGYVLAQTRSEPFLKCQLHRQSHNCVRFSEWSITSDHSCQIYMR